MYDNKNYNLYEHKRVTKKSNIFKKTIAFTLSALIFGSVAGASFYGINSALSYNNETSEYNSQLTEMSMINNVSSEQSSQNLDVSHIAEIGLPSVVSVTNISVTEVQNYFWKFGRNQRFPVQTQETVSCGSGIIFYAGESDLYIVSNYHVVEGATSLSVTFADNNTYEAQLCGYDSNVDLAVLKVPVSSISDETLSKIDVVTIGNSDDLVVGKQVVAIGNALGYGQSVTTGIVSAVNRFISSEATSIGYIQTDAAINPGNSGGALLNMNGELIGINTAKLSSTEIEGMGYAIPISQVIDIISSLMN